MRWASILAPVIIAALAILLPTPSSPRAQDVSPADEVVILRNQLRQMRGMTVQMGGVDVPGSLRILAERLIEIDARLQRAEQQLKK